MRSPPGAQLFALPDGRRYTARALLRRHVEAVWGVALPPLEDVVSGSEGVSLPATATPSWALYLGETLPDGQRIPLWRSDVSPDQRPLLLELAEAALAASPSPVSPPGQSHLPDTNYPTSAPTVGLITCEVALIQDARATATQPPDDALRLLRRIMPDDADLAALLAHFPFQNNDEDVGSEDEDDMTYFTSLNRQPVVGIVADGELLCVAHSSRRTTFACELGIETLADARRRGYALACTLRWAALVVAGGRIPFYLSLIHI